MKQKWPKIGLRSRGFTLIELLVVLSIIMVLTIFAVVNFSYVQQRAKLDFAADTLVSTLREGQVLAKSGRRVVSGEGEGILQCYAVRIVTGSSAGNGLYTGQSAYVGLPKEAVTGDLVDTCAPIQDAEWVKIGIFDGQIVVLGDGSTQTFYFKPPFAQIYQENGGALSKAGSQKLLFTIDNANNPATNPDDLKKVEFDLSTGAVKRI